MSRDWAMRRSSRIARRMVVLAALAAVVGACSSDLSLNNVTLAPKPESILRKPDWATFSGSKNEFELRPITPADSRQPGRAMCGRGGRSSHGLCRLEDRGRCCSCRDRRYRAADDGMRRGAARGPGREGRFRGQRPRRAHGDADLCPRVFARHLPIRRRAAGLDRGSARAAAGAREAEGGAEEAHGHVGE